MNVLLTADTVGGVWTFAVDLANELAARGTRVSLATMGAPLTDGQRAQAEAAGVDAVYESGYALEWMPDPWGDVERAGEWLLELARDSDADLVHLSGYAHAALPWDRPVVVTAHSCVLSWFEAVRGHPAPREWEGYRQRVSRGLAAADLVVAPTEWMLSELERLYAFDGARAVIPNGREPAAHEVLAKEPLIASAGRFWDDAKNVRVLVDLAPQLEWPVVLAGQGLDGGPRANLRPLGRVESDELQRLFARASIFALPARYEPFGLSALEAGLAGCALVLGDIPSLREVWGDAALFVDPDDTDALGHALRSLVHDDARRQKLAVAARARAEAYGAAAMATAYDTSYRSMFAREHVQAAHAASPTR